MIEGLRVIAAGIILKGLERLVPESAKKPELDSFLDSLPKADLWVNLGSDDGPDPLRLGVPVISFVDKDNFVVATPVPRERKRNGWETLTVKPEDNSSFFLQIRNKESGEIKEMTPELFQEMLAEKK